MSPNNLPAGLFLADFELLDPGTGKAIPLTRDGIFTIVTAAAETNTLGLPTRVGQIIGFTMKTDGGDRVITVASAFNSSGNTIITLNDVGDTIVLIGVRSGTTFRWQTLATDGPSLS